MMSKRFFTVVMLCFCEYFLNAQDIHFSQFYMAPLTQNPGLAGALENAEATLNYKTQWAAVTNPYKTYAASGMMRFNRSKNKPNFWAGGLNFFTDQSGDGQFSTTTAAFSLAYHVSLSRYHKLGLGLQGGFGQGRINFQDLQWGSQYGNGIYNAGTDPGENTGNQSFGYVDFGSGLLWSFNNTSGAVKTATNTFNKGCLGFSVFHINQPLYSFVNSGDRLHMKYVFHGHYLISIPNSELALFPGFMYYQQEPAKELLIGSMVRRNIFLKSKYSGFNKGGGAYLGVYLRTRDALVISSMLEFSHYSLGISYDINTSTLRSASNGRGGFEVTLRVTGKGLEGSKR